MTPADRNQIDREVRVGGLDDSTPLLEAGLESAVAAATRRRRANDDDAEIDATRLVDLRTVGDLKQWLHELSAVGAETGGGAR
ncbi:acyl carrier protein [Salinispora arenicola]|uniref:acyl carrier protein n=1 Tax=Salinispora arenicola TaxID=168697 RepID=UPI00169EB9A0|nr:acyl carrier protein [Salinispora arenicola]NIL64874.1 acyl carrier protein [Salinispora arenicola]